MSNAVVGIFCVNSIHTIWNGIKSQALFHFSFNVKIKSKRRVNASFQVWYIPASRQSCTPYIYTETLLLNKCDVDFFFFFLRFGCYTNYLDIFAFGLFELWQYENHSFALGYLSYFRCGHFRVFTIWNIRCLEMFTFRLFEILAM